PALLRPAFRPDCRWTAASAGPSCLHSEGDAEADAVRGLGGCGDDIDPIEQINAAHTLDVQGCEQGGAVDLKPQPAARADQGGEALLSGRADRFGYGAYGVEVKHGVDAVFQHLGGLHSEAVAHRAAVFVA